MKASLVRLKQIFGGYFNYFIISCLFTAGLYGIELLAMINLNPSLHHPSLVKALKVAFIAIIFILPAYNYMAFHISRKASGLIKTELDTKTMKKSLFLSAGILWSSIAWLIVSALLGNAEYLFFTTLAVSALSWHIIIKLLVRYGFTL